MSGENSAICAVTTGRTPPIPRPAKKRKALKVTGSPVRPAAAVKMLNSATQIEIVRTRPILSASVPKTMAPNIMPNRAELAMKPAPPALTPMSFMIDGKAAPTTARS